MKHELHNLIDWIFDIGFHPINTIRWPIGRFIHKAHCYCEEKTMLDKFLGNLFFSK